LFTCTVASDHGNGTGSKQPSIGRGNTGKSNNEGINSARTSTHHDFV
jgi:hypothetical protein